MRPRDSDRRRRRRSVLTVAVAVEVVALVAPGCGSTSTYSRSDTAGLPSTRQDIEQHEWALDPGGSTPTVDDTGDDANPVTLAVSGDAVSGAAPCNTYRGRFELDDDDTVDITDLALTMRACEPATMRAEGEWIAALEAVDHVHVEVDGDDAVAMTLDNGADSDGDGDVRLAFHAFDADEETPSATP